MQIEEFCAYFYKNFDKGYEVDNAWFVYRYQNNVVVVAILDEQVWLMNQTETWKEDVVNKIIEFKKEKMKKNVTCITHEGKRD